MKPKDSGNAIVVKSLHKTLRGRVKKGESPDVVWKDLIGDKKQLATYAKAMSNLAQEEWKQEPPQDRIKWTFETCKEYFDEGNMQRVARKYAKQLLFEKLRKQGIEETKTERNKIDEQLSDFKCDWHSACEDSDKLFLLDVGSCYNAYEKFDRFQVYSVDIAPANAKVYTLDFLNVQFSDTFPSKSFTKINELINSSLIGSTLPKSAFDITVFSLLLSFLPSPRQRLECCINAHSALRMNGLLIIVTPDSSHQNRNQPMMKSWRQALEAIGFKRYKYAKLDHLHCMAYRKSADNCTIDREEYGKYICIPQDFQDDDAVED